MVKKKCHFDRNELDLNLMRDHRGDLVNALLLLDLIDEEDSPGTSRLASLIALGKMAIGCKLELMDHFIAKTEEACHD